MLIRNLLKKTQYLGEILPMYDTNPPQNVVGQLHMQGCYVTLNGKGILQVYGYYYTMDMVKTFINKRLPDHPEDYHWVGQSMHAYDIDVNSWHDADLERFLVDLYCLLSQYRTK